MNPHGLLISLLILLCLVLWTPAKSYGKEIHQSGDPTQRLIETGQSMMWEGDIAQAIKYFEEAENRSQEPDQKRKAWEARINALYLLDHEAASREQRQLLNWLKKQPTLQLQYGQALRQAAQQPNLEKAPRIAVRFLLRSLQVFREIGAKEQQLVALLHIVQLNMNRRNPNFARAIPFLTEAIDLTKEIGDSTSIAILSYTMVHWLDKYDKISEVKPYLDLMMHHATTESLSWLQVLGQYYHGRFLENTGYRNRALSQYAAVRPKLDTIREDPQVLSAISAVHLTYFLKQRRFQRKDHPKSSRRKSKEEKFRASERWRLLWEEGHCSSAFEFVLNFDEQPRPPLFKSLDKRSATLLAAISEDVAKREKVLLLQSHEERLRLQKRLLLLAGLFAIALCILLYTLYRSKYKSNALLANKNEIIKGALSEKELLLKEVHHRVKNNLQTISSLLSLQSRFVADPTALSAIQEGRNRVQSMAIIHQRLYQHKDVKSISVQSYIQQLSEYLFEVYNVSEERIKLHADIDPVNLDVDTVIPIGLILNELITNALKHAFPQDTIGKIKISLKAIGGQLELKVADNGIGLQQKIEKAQKTSFGYLLIETFAQKLNARLQVHSNNGTTVCLKMAA